MYISISSGVLGPFSEVLVLSDRLHVDGVDYQFSIIGDYSILDDSQYTPPPLESEYIIAVQLHLDNEAKTRGYDSILSATTYATSTNARYRAEGQACVEWRDAVWSSAFNNIKDKITVAALIDLLPKMEWPVE